jgi:polygalacturonase
MMNKVNILIGLLALTVNSLNITDCPQLTLGPVLEPAYETLNSECFVEFLKAANSSDSDRTVLFPAGTVVSMMPMIVSNLRNVTISIDGTVLASKNWKEWPYLSQPSNDLQGKVRYHDLWVFDNCDGLNLNSPASSGVIDGQGYMWWVREFLGKNKAHRPHIIQFFQSRNIELSHLLIKNSPSFHIVPIDVENVYMHDFEILVDIVGQLEISNLFMDTILSKFENMSLL